MPPIDSARRDALPPGTSLREYTLECVIGHGGFGIVYRAQHDELGGTVAIKEYLPVELAVREGVSVRVRSGSESGIYEDGLRRFRDEARVLMQFQDHPGIVSCRDFFRANGTAYMVMEFEEGRSLAEVLAIREAEGRPFGQEDLLGLMVPLLDGLQRIHESGLLHRDIKPSNILIRRADDRPVLIDFGAAKQGVATKSKSMAPYTEGYAAMEQIANPGALGTWTDMYGVGAVMWRMVAGGNPPWQPLHPTRVESRSHALSGDLEDPLPTAVQLGKGRFTRSVLDGIDGCLRLHERRRIQNCRELLGVLQGNRTDPEDIPFGHRFPALNQFMRTKVRAILRIEWMPILLRAAFVCTLARLTGLALPIRLIRDLRPSEQILSRTVLDAVVNGDSSAQFELGKQYFAGSKMREDCIDAVRWYRKAGHQGHAEAQCRLGDLYYFGLGVPRDYAAAAEWYRRAAKQGEPEAQCMLGGLYQLGKGVARDGSKAVEWFSKAASQGHEDAQYLLGGKAQELGQVEGPQKGDAETEDSYSGAAILGSVQSQCRLALLHLRRLATVFKYHHIRKALQEISFLESGIGEAAYMLGKQYIHGNPLARDHREATDWYRIAADLGHVKAQLALGEHYQNHGWDFMQAAKWYRRAAEQGDLESQYRLGRLYWFDLFGHHPSSLYNEGEESQHFSEVFKWYFTAAEQGHVEAQHELLKLYDWHSFPQLFYRGLRIDQEEMDKWYRFATDQGHQRAHFTLGKLHSVQEERHYKRKARNGDASQGLSDYSEAARWYRIAADEGHLEAYFLLGALYERVGVSQDYVEAIKWYQKAAREGDSKSQHRLAMLYSKDGTVRDYSQAAKWYRSAADQDNKWAQYKLAYAYDIGRGVAQNDAEAAKWYRSATGGGYRYAYYRDAYYRLGLLYERDGVLQNYIEAAKWYRKAVDAGHRESMHQLGCLYRRGLGVARDYTKATRWYRRAAIQGCPRSEEFLGRIERGLRRHALWPA